MTGDSVKAAKEPIGFDKTKTKTAIKALLGHISKKKTDSLFLDSPTRFLLDITTFKTPSGIHEYYNIVLPNSPFPDHLESLDVLLVVRDQKDKEAEHIIGEVQDDLRNSCKADDIKVRQIMTLTQLRDDFATFEAKRALAKSVDVVIAENQLFKTLPRILGREFQKKKKFHLGIPGREFKEKDLGEQIWYALQKTVLHISMKGQTSTIVVGHDNLNADELTENVSKIANWLKRKFPGGWRNIQKLSISIALDGVPPLVVYFSTGSANDIKKPPITRGGAIEDPVLGDVSTQPCSQVRVHADGQIEVFDDKGLSEEDRILFKELEESRQKYRKNRKQQQLKVKKEEPVPKKEEEDSEEEVEEMEAEEDETEEMSEDEEDAQDDE